MASSSPSASFRSHLNAYLRSALLTAWLCMAASCVGGSTLVHTELFTPQPITTHAASPTVSGKVIGALLRSRLEELRDIGHDWARVAERSIEASLRQLEDTLKESIDKPLHELSGSLRLVADRALVTAHQVTAMLAASTSCLREDTRLIAAVLDASLTANVNDAAFWAGKKPFIGYGHVVAETTRHGLKIDQDPTAYRFLGYLGGQDSCGSVTAELRDPEDAAIPVAVLSADVRSVVVRVPSLARPGIYQATIQSHTKRRKWYGLWLWKKCERQAPISAVVAVSQAPRFSVEYDIRASCPVTMTRQKSADLRVANTACSGDRTSSTQVCPDSGYSRVAYAIQHLSGSGCWTGTQEAGGGCVQLWVTCPDKGGLFCTGPVKSWNGTLHIEQTTTVAVPAQSSITGTLDVMPEYGQSVRQAIVDPGATPVPDGGPASACTWTVGVTLRSPDGRELALPVRSGAGELTASAASGAAYQWSPALGTLHVQTPPYTCPVF